MKWASMLLVLAMVGCGAAPAIEDEGATRPAPAETEPSTPLEAIEAACPSVDRVQVLEIIELMELNRQAGRTFGESIDWLDQAGECSRGCRQCFIAAIEWVYFGLLPE